jgi:hypothetical protein
MAQAKTWAAFDVHVSGVVAAVLERDFGELWVRRLSGRSENVAAFTAALPGPVPATYEAGPTGFVLARRLEAVGVECVVCAPGLIPRGPSDRVKTDRRDAERLVRLLAAGGLHAGAARSPSPPASTPAGCWSKPPGITAGRRGSPAASLAANATASPRSSRSPGRRSAGCTTSGRGFARSPAGVRHGAAPAGCLRFRDSGHSSPWPNGGPSGLFARAKQPPRWSAYGAAMTEMSYVIPVVNEIVDPRSGRPISAIGDQSQSQRALVAASLLRLPDR